MDVQKLRVVCDICYTCFKDEYDVRTTDVNFQIVEEKVIDCRPGEMRRGINSLAVLKCVRTEVIY